MNKADENNRFREYSKRKKNLIQNIEWAIRLAYDIENSGNYVTNSPEFSNGQFLKISNTINRIVHIETNNNALIDMDDNFIRILNLNRARLLCGNVYSLWGHNVLYDSDPVYKKIWVAYRKISDIIKEESDYGCSQHLRYLSLLAEKFHYREMSKEEYHYLFSASIDDLQFLHLKEKMEESFVSMWI